MALEKLSFTTQHCGLHPLYSIAGGSPRLRDWHTTLLTVLHLRCELLDLYGRLKEIITAMNCGAGLFQNAFGIRFGC